MTTGHRMTTERKTPPFCFLVFSYSSLFFPFCLEVVLHLETFIFSLLFHLPLAFFSVPLALLLSLISERNKPAMQMDRLWQTSCLVFASVWVQGRDSWKSKMDNNPITTSSHNWVSALSLTPCGSSEASECELTYSYALKLFALYLCCMYTWFSSRNTKRPHCAILCAPSSV